MSESDGKCTVCEGLGVILGIFGDSACIACGNKGTWKAQQDKSKS